MFRLWPTWLILTSANHNVFDLKLTKKQSRAFRLGIMEEAKTIRNHQIYFQLDKTIPLARDL